MELMFGKDRGEAVRLLDRLRYGIEPSVPGVAQARTVEHVTTHVLGLGGLARNGQRITGNHPAFYRPAHLLVRNPGEPRSGRC